MQRRPTDLINAVLSSSKGESASFPSLLMHCCVLMQPCIPACSDKQNKDTSCVF